MSDILGHIMKMQIAIKRIFIDIYKVAIAILDVLKHSCGSIIVTMHSLLTLLLPSLILMVIHGAYRSVELVWVLHGIHRAFDSLDLPSFLCGFAGQTVGHVT